MKKQISKKLSAFIIVTMMFSVNAHAQIIYTDVNPDITYSSSGTYSLDLNNDGTIDYSIVAGSGSSQCSKFVQGSISHYVRITPLNQNAVAFKASANVYPSMIDSGKIINDNKFSFQNSANQILRYSNQPTIYSNYNGQIHCTPYYPTTFSGNWNTAANKYLGLKLLVNGQYYFGWAKLSVSSTAFTIREYAFDSTPSHSIRAGATSGARISANATPARMLNGQFQSPFNKRNSLAGRNNPSFQNQNVPQARIHNSSICSQKTYGGSDDEYFAYVLKLHDGNYMLYGNSDSDDGDLTGNHGEDDGYLIKINAAGNILWSKTYGGSAEDGFNQLVEKSNGDIVAVGYAESNDGDVSGNHGGIDGWLVKVDKDGNIKSQHCYGGSADDYFQGIVKGTNGSYIIAGIVGSDDGDVTGAGNHGGEADGWVVKINQNGNLMWQKCIGGSDYEQFTSIISINNKYYVSGGTFSFDGDATQNHSAAGHFDQFLAKLKSNGDIQWVACHGGSNDDYCIIQSLIPTPDGNLINVGTTLSTDGDVQGHINYEADAWAPKISAATGALISQRCYGSVTRMQGFYTGIPTHDGGFLLVGSEASNFNIDSTYNAMVIKTDANGNEVWKKVFGGSDQDIVEGIAPMDNGNYLLACYSRSSDGDVTNQHGNGDIWMVELGNCSGHNNRETQFDATPDLLNSSLNCFPNPLSNSATISFSLPHSGNVSVSIFDMNGRLIKTLADNLFEEGEHQIKFNAEKINEGIYFLKMQSGEFLKTEKLIVTK